MYFHRLTFIVPFFCFLLAAAAFMGATVATAQAIPLIEGSLVQAQGDSKVYFIHNAQKRWVVSEQAFNGQGFRWSDIITVEPNRVAAYSDGPEINGDAFVGPLLEPLILPDLAPVAPYDIRFAVEGGRTRLRFTATFWNRGQAAFELNATGATQAGDAEFHATQKLRRANGATQEHPVGTLFWHNVHSHYHYDDFGSYVLEMVRPAVASSVPVPVVTSKTTFCMRDDLAIGAPAEGPKQARTYTGCSGQRQGVSIGWADVYPSTLPDQYVDVTDLPAGVYKLTFNVDPFDHFAEMRRDNNTSVTFIDINPAARTLRIVGAASPYESPNNRFPDGTVIQAEGDPQVYAVYRNKKRIMRSDAVLAAYGLSRASALVLPRRALDMIPSETLIRVEGTSEIYALNVAGFRRRILNPDIFASYGWKFADVTEIKQAEFDAMPFTNLIVRIGDERVFSMSSKRQIGTFPTLRALGFNPDSVHGVNEMDFRAYTITNVASDLEIPWDIAFLPNGDMLVTERTGTLRRLGAQPASFPIPNVHTAGEGGLMGIALHPQFAENQFVYLYYTTSDGGRKNRITRFRLSDDALTQDLIILDNIPSATYHDGGKIAFGPDNKLYAVTGDAQTPDSAQNTNSLAGKTLRMNDDGSVPSDNPFGNLVWSYGHRNPQGIAWNAQGRMYITEHGPTGEFGLCCRDEINRIDKGGNYGWPIIRGSEQRTGMHLPTIHSGDTNTWAPSGLARAENRIFFAGLRGTTLYQSIINSDGSLTNPTSHLTNQFGRLRGVVLGPDGYLYLTTSNRDGRGTVRAGDDKILRIHPDALR